MLPRGPDSFHEMNRAQQVSGGSDYLFFMNETSSITAPVEMAASATLKDGQCRFPTYTSRKSITSPNLMRSIRFPMAPPVMQTYAIRVQLSFLPALPYA